MAEIQTLVIDNFQGRMTQNVNGDINSGLSSVYESSGATPFPYPRRLTWGCDATQIDPAGSVITDLIVAGKIRNESNTVFTYAIGHTGRLYKIQSNDPATFNPDYDNPVLLTTLTINSPTFTRGGFIDFFGATEKIYIGHDKGVTSVNFDGTGEAYVGDSGQWAQNVPRPLQQFVGKLYIGNGENLAEIDSTATVTTYSKLSPAFPKGSQVRDMDVTPEGNYLETVVSTLAMEDITAAVQPTTQNANKGSFIFRWNGTDTGYTSFASYPDFSLTANTLFQNNQYAFGYDQNGGAVFDPANKVLSLQEVQPPMPNAVNSIGNLVTFFTVLPFGGFMEAELFSFGIYDFESGLGYWDLFFQVATGDETDVVRVPCQIPVSNFGIGPVSNGYADGIYSTSKLYYSTIETSSAPTTKYKFYKLPIRSTPFDSTPAMIDAIYQTQNQLFSKKIRISEVRIYADPWVASNSFEISLVGSGGTAISGSTKTFTAGSNLTIGDDFAWYAPDCAPTYSVAVRITNKGTTNFVINKIEVDYSTAGK